MLRPPGASPRIIRYDRSVMQASFGSMLFLGPGLRGGGRDYLVIDGIAGRHIYIIFFTGVLLLKLGAPPWLPIGLRSDMMSVLQ